jgi:hypothetical protein
MAKSCHAIRQFIQAYLLSCGACDHQSLKHPHLARQTLLVWRDEAERPLLRQERPAVHRIRHHPSPVAG